MLLKKLLLLSILSVVLLSCDKDYGASTAPDLDEDVTEQSDLPNDVIAFLSDSTLLKCDLNSVVLELMFSDTLKVENFDKIEARISTAKVTGEQQVTEKWIVNIVEPKFCDNGFIDQNVMSYVEVTPVRSQIMVGDIAKLTVTLTSKNRETHSISINIEATQTGLSNIPHIYIYTDGGDAIVSKEEYLYADIVIDGKDRYENFSGRTRIKGRGNSTWVYYPKKPYKLKLDDKASLLGLDEEKEWVLLANYIDPTLIINPVAMEVGRVMGTPYVNNMIGVDVTINGVYNGFYCFTEQIEIKNNRVNLSDEGYILELDSYFDEEWKFKSSLFDLPVMLKDGEVKTQDDFNRVIEEFEALELLVGADDFPNNNYAELLDLESLANLLLVNEIMQNCEISHPKSTHLFKDIYTKFTYGPIWDYDWCCGFDGSNEHFTTLLKGTINTSIVGGRYFSTFFNDPSFVQIYKERWAYFKENHSEYIIKYIGDFSDSVELSAKANFQVWPNGKLYNEQIELFKEWMMNRIEYLDAEIMAL